MSPSQTAPFTARDVPKQSHGTSLATNVPVSPNPWSGPWPKSILLLYLKPQVTATARLTPARAWAEAAAVRGEARLRTYPNRAGGYWQVTEVIIWEVGMPGLLAQQSPLIWLPLATHQQG